MKNNKTTTYILLLLVMGLWIVVFYRIYKSFFAEKEALIVSHIDNSKVIIKEEEVETFVLKADYRDPFMGGLYQTFENGPSYFTGSPRKSIVKKVPKPKVEEVKMDWSFINYLGLIKNKQSNKMVALVIVYGRQLMVSEGDVQDNVTFINNGKDSIKVSYQGKSTFIKR